MINANKAFSGRKTGNWTLYYRDPEERTESSAEPDTDTGTGEKENPAVPLCPGIVFPAAV